MKSKRFLVITILGVVVVLLVIVCVAYMSFSLDSDSNKKNAEESALEEVEKEDESEVYDMSLDLCFKNHSLEFYPAYKADERQNAFDALADLDKKYAEDPINVGKKSLMAYLTNGNIGGSVLGYASSKTVIESVDLILAYGKERQILPTDMVLRWSVKPEKSTDYKTKKEVVLGYGLYVLQSTNGKPALVGDCVADATVGYDDFKGHTVSMKMNSEGAKAWARVTGANVGNQIAIVRDHRVYSAPNVNEAIEGGSSEITGYFSEEEARGIANVLKSLKKR